MTIRSRIHLSRCATIPHQKEERRMYDVILESTITCTWCGYAQTETMPEHG